MGFISRPLSDLAKLTSTDVAIFLRGKHAFERGEPFDPHHIDLWRWGWCVGADQRRQKAEATLCH